MTKEMKERFLTKKDEKKSQTWQLLSLYEEFYIFPIHEEK